MNRRNFFKGLCALAVAPLAAALPMAKPSESFPNLTTLSDGPEPTLDKSIIRKMEAQLSGDHVKPYDSQTRARLVLDWSAHRLHQSLQNPEIVKQLAGYGYKVDYEALARMFKEVAL